MPFQFDFIESKKKNYYWNNSLPVPRRASQNKTNTHKIKASGFPTHVPGANIYHTPTMSQACHRWHGWHSKLVRHNSPTPTLFPSHLGGPSSSDCWSLGLQQCLADAPLGLTLANLECSGQGLPRSNRLTVQWGFGCHFTKPLALLGPSVRPGLLLQGPLQFFPSTCAGHDVFPILHSRTV